MSEGPTAQRPAVPVGLPLTVPVEGRPSESDLDALAAAWARLGVLFGVEPAPDPVDLEALICATARAAPHPSGSATSTASAARFARTTSAASAIATGEST